MIVIIAGGRDVVDFDHCLKAAELAPFEISKVVSGTARGADKLGEQYAAENNLPLINNQLPRRNTGWFS